MLWISQSVLCSIFFNIQTALAGFSEIAKSYPVKNKRIDEVNLETLLMYDTPVFGFERHPFSRKWLLHDWTSCTCGHR